MPISETDFEIWARRDGAQRVVLAELAYACEVAGVMEERTVYLSTKAFTTGPDDSPPHTAYHGIISSAAEIGVGIDVNTLSGPSTLTVGELQLNNASGVLDPLMRLIVDGREVRFYVGSPDWKRSDFRLAGVGVVRRISKASEALLVLDVADKRLLMDAALQGSAVASGPEAGKLKARLYGAVYNHSPVLLDATALTYSVLENYSGTTFVAEVRDAGSSLGNFASGALFSGDNTALTANAGTDTLTFVGHGLSLNDVVLVESTGTVFAGMTVGTRYWVVGVVGNNFQLATTRGGAPINITGTTFTGEMSFKRFRYMDTTAVDGQIQLSAAPAGSVTCDVQTANQTEKEPFDLSRRLILEASSVESADIDASAFAGADAALLQRLGAEYPTVGIAVTDRTNLISVLNDLLVPLGGWYGQDYDGVIRAGVIDPASLQSKAHTRTLSRGQMRGEITLENLAIVFGGASINATRNWTVQPDGLNTGLPELTKAQFRRPFREKFNDGNGFLAPSVAYLPNWWSSHKTAIPFERDSFLTSKLDVSGALARATTSVATAQVLDAQPHHQLLTVTVSFEACNWRLGEIVRVTMPRYGFSQGYNFALVSRRVDPVKEELQLGLITQVTPDYLNSSFR